MGRLVRRWVFPENSLWYSKLKEGKNGVAENECGFTSGCEGYNETDSTHRMKMMMMTTTTFVR
jgi:hypothetical protein